MTKQYKPLGEMVLVQHFEEEEKTESGLILTEKPKDKLGMVVGTLLDFGEDVKTSVFQGEDVMFRKVQAICIDEDQGLYLMNQDLMMCVVKEE